MHKLEARKESLNTVTSRSIINHLDCGGKKVTNANLHQRNAPAVDVSSHNYHFSSKIRYYTLCDSRNVQHVFSSFALNEQKKEILKHEL